MAARIDVSIEHKHAPPEARADGKPHPNTCPGCGSHYRDDELEQHLNVCPQCGHHFPMRARERIKQLADEGSFTEEAAELRSDDPLGFFDLRPYTERLAEAEVATGLGDAMVTGHATLDGTPLQLAVMDFAFMGGSMGRVVGAASVAVQLDEVLEHPFNVVQRVGPVRMARELDRAPDVRVARLGDDPVELPL